MKSFFKSTIAVIVVIAFAIGIVKGFQYYNDSKINNDTSYKVKTKRNSKYNGIYTLTKLDEDSNNTWNGLICYVKNDKIISANLVEFESRDDIIKNQLNGNKDATGSEILNATTLEAKIKLGNAKQTGFCHGISPLFSQGVVVYVGQMLLEEKVDLKKDYDDIKSCNAMTGYDEDSQEVWLSKLLSNEKSEYHEGYKLIHYNDYNDMKECPIDEGECIRKLNDLFNANIKDWEDL